MQSCEVTSTALYAHALDRFLFDDSNILEGACVHQLQVYKSQQAVEKPDMYIVKFVNGFPCTPIGLHVSDVKNTDMEKAKTNLEDQLGELVICSLQQQMFKFVLDPNYFWAKNHHIVALL